MRKIKLLIGLLLVSGFVSQAHANGLDLDNSFDGFNFCDLSQDDAFYYLLSLGYSEWEAKEALSSCSESDSSDGDTQASQEQGDENVGNCGSNRCR